jgi:hypothetical protein
MISLCFLLPMVILVCKCVVHKEFCYITLLCIPTLSGVTLFSSLESFFQFYLLLAKSSQLKRFLPRKYFTGPLRITNVFLKEYLEVGNFIWVLARVKTPKPCYPVSWWYWYNLIVQRLVMIIWENIHKFKFEVLATVIQKQIFSFQFKFPYLGFACNIFCI